MPHITLALTHLDMFKLYPSTVTFPYFGQMIIVGHVCLQFSQQFRNWQKVQSMDTGDM